MAEALPPQPAWAPLWTGPLEAGDTHFLVSRGYVHVIGIAARRRQVGRRRLARMGQLRPDRMDRRAALVRRQCRHGRHFRLRRRAVSRRQAAAAASQGDLPVRPARRLRRAGRLPRGISGRRAAPVPLSGRPFRRHAPAHGARPAKLPEPRETYWREAMANPDYRMYPNIFNLLAQKGQHMPPYFDLLIDPYDKEEVVEKSEAESRQDQGAVLHRLRLVRLHVQDPPQRRAELFRQHRRAQEADVHRARASRAPVPLVPRRDPALVRPLAQGHRHRRHARAAGQVLGHGREQVAPRRRLAAARDPVDQALSAQLGAADAPSRSRRRASIEFTPPDAFVQMPPTPDQRRSSSCAT